jgi:hypothetical protein
MKDRRAARSAGPERRHPFAWPRGPAAAWLRRPFPRRGHESRCLSPRGAREGRDRVRPGRLDRPCSGRARSSSTASRPLARWDCSTRFQRTSFLPKASEHQEPRRRSSQLFGSRRDGRWHRIRRGRDGIRIVSGRPRVRLVRSRGRGRIRMRCRNGNRRRAHYQRQVGRKLLMLSPLFGRLVFPPGARADGSPSDSAIRMPFGPRPGQPGAKPLPIPGP